jgi:molybdate transport system permease protein
MWGWQAILMLASLPFLLFLLLPLLALVLQATPAKLLANLVDPTITQAIQLSFVTTLLTLGITLLGGTPLAYLLARGNFPGKVLLDTLIDLPIVMPPAVAGIALLLAFGRFGLLGRWLNVLGVDIAFTPIAVIMAQTFIAAPFYIKSATTAFASVNRGVEEAAAVDGAGRGTIFYRIILPLCFAPLAGGALMTWARALGEFGATIIFAGNFPGITQTMPLAIYLGFDQDLGGAITLSIVLLILSFVVLFIVRTALHQRISVETQQWS